ncbi:hypothetical protein ACJW30_05G117900 [Castanea mollissima]
MFKTQQSLILSTLGLAIHTLLRQSTVTRPYLTHKKGNMFFLTASDPQYMFLLDFSLIRLVPLGLHNA